MEWRRPRGNTLPRKELPPLVPCTGRAGHRFGGRQGRPARVDRILPGTVQQPQCNIL